MYTVRLVSPVFTLFLCTCYIFSDSNKALRTVVTPALVARGTARVHVEKVQEGDGYNHIASPLAGRYIGWMCMQAGEMDLCKVHGIHLSFFMYPLFILQVSER